MDLHILSLCRFVLPLLTVVDSVPDVALDSKDACLVLLTPSYFFLECDLCCVYLVSVVLDIPLPNNTMVKVEVVWGDIVQGGSLS